MAQTKKAKQENEQSQLEANESTQTPPSRQAGANQPQHTQGSQGMVQRGEAQNRGLSRQGQFTSPFSFMRRFSEEMDRLFDDFGFGGTSVMPGFGRSFLSPSFGREFEQMSTWSPQLEVSERGDNLVICADLPGMSKDDINVDIEDDQLIIRGERRNERQSDEQGFYHSERSYGSFYRSIQLPQGVDGEQVQADFNNGVLEITIPKPEQKSRGRRLEINERGSQAKMNQNQ